MPSPFCLTDAMIARGSITDEEMTDFTGVPIVSFFMDDLPGWNALKKIDLQDPIDETIFPPPLQKERQKALLNVLSQSKFHKTLPLTIFFDSIQEASFLRGPTFFSCGSMLSSSDAYPCAKDAAFSSGVCCDFYDALFCIKQDSSLVLNPAYSREQKRRSSFMSFSVTDSFYFPVTGLYASLRQPDDAFYCLRHLYQPIESVKNLPSAKSVRLTADLHEMAHVFQLSQSNPWPKIDWLKETHAELFCWKALEQNPQIRYCLHEIKQERYWNFLIVEDSHLLAPTVDALVANKPAPDYEKTVAARDEIYSHLGGCFAGIDYTATKKAWKEPNDVSHVVLKDSSITHGGNKTIESFYNNADQIMTTLDWLAERKAFATPLVQQIAERIVEAAEFFNPAYTKARISLPRRSFPAAKIGSDQDVSVIRPYEPASLRAPKGQQP